MPLAGLRQISVDSHMMFAGDADKLFFSTTPKCQKRI